MVYTATIYESPVTRLYFRCDFIFVSPIYLNHSIILSNKLQNYVHITNSNWYTLFIVLSLSASGSIELLLWTYFYWLIT